MWVMQETLYKEKTECTSMPNFQKFFLRKKKKFWVLSYAVIGGSLDFVLDYEFSF